jgi:DNA invertase Pin-like site-specific DNA recombinase
MLFLLVAQADNRMIPQICPNRVNDFQRIFMRTPTWAVHMAYTSGVRSETKVTAEIEALVIGRYLKEPRKVASIAADLGISRTTVYNILNRNRIWPNRQKEQDGHS